MVRRNCILTEAGLLAVTTALERLPALLGTDSRKTQRITVSALARHCDVSYTWAQKIMHRKTGVTENRVREVFKVLTGAEPIFGHHYTGGDEHLDFPMEDLPALNARYHVRPANGDNLPWMAELEVKWFGRYAASEPAMRAWFRANPTGFVVIEKDGERLGFYTFLPFKPEWMRRFCHGELRAPQIGAEGIHSPDEYDQVRELYAEAIIINTTSKVVIAKALDVIVGTLAENVSRVGDPRNLTNIYCMPVTSAGKSVAGKLGLRLSVRAADRPAIRVDLHAVTYSIFAASALRYKYRQLQTPSDAV